MGSVGPIPPRARQVVAERSNGQCELCRGVAQEIHHRDPRGSGGTSDKRIHRVSNLLHLCRTAHQFCESYRAHAYDAGWLIRSGVNTDPATMRVWLSGVLYGAGWWLLADDGTLKWVDPGTYGLPDRPAVLPPCAAPARKHREGMPPHA